MDRRPRPPSRGMRGTGDRIPAARSPRAVHRRRRPAPSPPSVCGHRSFYAQRSASADGVHARSESTAQTLDRCSTEAVPHSAPQFSQCQPIQPKRSRINTLAGYYFYFAMAIAGEPKCSIHVALRCLRLRRPAPRDIAQAPAMLGADVKKGCNADTQKMLRLFVNMIDAAWRALACRRPAAGRRRERPDEAPDGERAVQRRR